MSIQESLKIVPQGPDIALLEFDLIGEKVNKLSTPVMKRFEEVLRELKSSAYKVVIIVSRKQRIFIAGADIEEIKSIREKDQAKLAAAEGQRIFNLIEDLPMPVIAAINGACLGGGCEMALACDYRICTDDSSTRIGLPETKLGIIPGFGGCVRLPRVIGLQAALDIILQGKSVDGKKAEKLGLVDKCVPVEILEEQALKMARELIADKAKKRKKVFEPKGIVANVLESGLGRPIVLSKAKGSVKKATRGNYPAPLKAIDVVGETYGMRNRGDALEIEARNFGDVAITDVSKNLIHIFYLTEAIKKQTGVADPNVKPRKVEKLAVLGAGTMGGGIAQLGADKGIDSRMKDINNEALSRGIQHAYRIWEKALKRRRISKYELGRKMALISGATDYTGFKAVDVVVEAIVEDMNIKKKVIRETYDNCNPNVIIATNTSSLSVNEMCEGFPKPENFVGMHFFNPVDKMPLIEVIRGNKTSDEVTATIFDLSKKMGKMPVVVKDGPGFLVNRLLLPYLNEAVYLLGEGMSVETLDEAFLDFGMPMGPLHLIDEIGIDVAVKVAKIFHKAFGERAEPSGLMAKVVESGRLGKKNGKGFYKYDEAGKKLEVDQTIYDTLGLARPTNKHKTDECVRRGIFAMINEATLALLEDRIVEKADDVDLAMIMGTGFPPFRGGLLKYADSVGSEVIADELELYATKFGPRFKPSNPLKQMAKTKRRFYGGN
jgi:3-hydroxyacyl-CoA dehydrogenase/enoyl-CoA hydratase/3-hydroxybutyryl-CoA epimerase